MSNLKKDIEKILRDVYYAGHDDTDLEWGTPDEHHSKDIINLIESVVGEIIGEDEKEMVLVESEITVAKEHGYRTKIEKSEWFDEKIHARNKLRKEQRDIKSKLIGKE